MLWLLFEGNKGEQKGTRKDRFHDCKYYVYICARMNYMFIFTLAQISCVLLDLLGAGTDERRRHYAGQSTKPSPPACGRAKGPTMAKNRGASSRAKVFQPMNRRFLAIPGGDSRLPCLICPNGAEATHLLAVAGGRGCREVAAVPSGVYSVTHTP